MLLFSPRSLLLCAHLINSGSASSSRARAPDLDYSLLAFCSIYHRHLPIGIVFSLVLSLSVFTCKDAYIHSFPPLSIIPARSSLPFLVTQPPIRSSSRHGTTIAHHGSLTFILHIVRILSQDEFSLLAYQHLHPSITIPPYPYDFDARKFISNPESDFVIGRHLTFFGPLCHCYLRCARNARSIVLFTTDRWSCYWDFRVKALSDCCLRIVISFGECPTLSYFVIGLSLSFTGLFHFTQGPVHCSLLIGL